MSKNTLRVIVWLNSSFECSLCIAALPNRSLAVDYWDQELKQVWKLNFFLIILRAAVAFIIPLLLFYYSVVLLQHY